MIDHCPHCGRAVANDEQIGYSRIGWMPTSCMTGDGPQACYDGDRELVTNHQHFYTSVIDEGSGRYQLVTGPHRDYDAAKADEWRAVQIATRADAWASFYTFGVASSNERFKTYEEKCNEVRGVQGEGETGESDPPRRNVGKARNGRKVRKAAQR